MDGTVVTTTFAIRLKGLDHSFPCRAGERLLVAMERAKKSSFGLAWPTSIPVGCRRGGCGVCRVRVLDGAYTTAPMSATHVSAEEQAQGYALSCCVFPHSDLLVETAPKAAAQQDQDTSKKD